LVLQVILTLSNINKDGSNSALQESIGDSIFLAAMTPQHWHRLRLITDDELYIKPENYQANAEPKLNEFDLEMLLRMGLSKIPQIPFEYILDEFRWNMFNGNVGMENANDFYWMLSQKEQGIRPVADWLIDQHLLFDAGAKYHVADNTPFIR
jgi:peptidyl-dipeptidase A